MPHLCHCLLLDQGRTNICSVVDFHYSARELGKLSIDGNPRRLICPPFFSPALLLSQPLYSGTRLALLARRRDVYLLSPADGVGTFLAPITILFPFSDLKHALILCLLLLLMLFSSHTTLTYVSFVQSLLIFQEYGSGAAAPDQPFPDAGSALPTAAPWTWWGSLHSCSLLSQACPLGDRSSGT